MAKIKHTKNELKAQRDALARFLRYLPTLQLKKQQLQVEIRQLAARIEEQSMKQQRLLEELDSWIGLFAEPFDFNAHLELASVELTEGNIAGVSIPVIAELRFDRRVPDLYATPPWVDDGLDALEKAISLHIELLVLHEQERLIREELRITNQRVNLFEKVKIPEAREHIRVIRIFLGDQQTQEVARGKIAKKKSAELNREAA